MSIKTIEYTVDIAGISPATEQFAGTQGDHRVTKVKFEINDHLGDAITDYTAEINGKAMYRFDVYDGEGGIWQSQTSELENYTLSMELEERHTRYGGKVMVYLVLTTLSADNGTEIELYNFPAKLRLKNRPDGRYQDGENYESVTGLVEVAKGNAAAAERFAENADNAVKQAVSEVVALAEAEAQRATDEAEKAYASAKAATTALNDINTTIAGSTDQIYTPESENAQSGIAVAEAVNGCVPKVKAHLYMPPWDAVIAVSEADMPDENGLPLNESYKHIPIEDESVGLQPNFIVRRNSHFNIQTSAPIDDNDCANKKYVDDAIANANIGDGTIEMPSFKLVVVAELPEIGEENTIYLLPSENSQEQNLYDEYIYTIGAWEKIGSASVKVDLSGYVEKKEYNRNQTVVGNDGGCAATLYAVDFHGNETTMPAWTQIQVGSVPVRDAVGNFYIGEPTIKFHAATKGYVDDLIGDIETLLGGI